MAARRMFTISVLLLLGCHYFSCADWWAIRLQGPSPSTLLFAQAHELKLLLESDESVYLKDSRTLCTIRR